MLRSEEERSRLVKKIANLTSSDFEAVALEVFRYQSRYNAIYRKYLNALNKQRSDVQGLTDIPFLPIELFKGHTIKTGLWPERTYFTSSGTTGQQTSKHYVRDLAWYRRHARRGFSTFYGEVADYCILALLPSYLERSGSSLVFMVNEFIKASKWPQSGFFLDDHDELVCRLKDSTARNLPTLLLGVSFALLDLAEKYSMDLRGCIIMETGGMKGRRKEIIRQEMHYTLSKAFNVSTIHSEYGMTELLSQAYSQAGGVFYPSPTMRILVRDMTDPFHWMPTGRTGAINVVDLANLDTISFIATDDLGRRYDDLGFEVLGRLDNSDLRGCNMLVS